MKVRKLTPTKAKLPDNEKVIGGHGNTVTKKTLNNIDKDVKKHLQKNAKNTK